MACGLDLNELVKHLVNGTLAENLCIICLAPLNGQYENIFTKICKEDREYCIADVLETVCQIKFENETANYNVCVNCFVNASLSYKFFLQSKTSEEILNYYTDQLTQSVNSITNEEPPSCIFIPLPSYEPRTFSFNFDLDGIGSGEQMEKPTGTQSTPIKNEDDVVVVVQDNGELMFYKIENGEMILLDDYEKQNYNEVLSQSATVVGKKKLRKKRGPMAYKSCRLCPVKYRFVAKLQQHMKVEHNVNLYVCKVCKAITEDELEYHNHLKTHTNIHQCALCNTVFKKRDTIIAHLKWHEKMKNIGQSDTAHICEICGVILEDEQSLTEHWENRHYKKYTCYYCGRMYKGETSLEMHIKKHEEHIQGKEKKQNAQTPRKNEVKKPPKPDAKPRCTCTTCGKNFVDQRSLLWHQRLHNNERPYSCDECGRSFVSLNRRNQHALCAHTAPARRCPLCPALFHLRSMVNTHVKKVHLKAHKRRNRTSKYEKVYWRTEPVPIQELSVSIQNEILEMQAAKDIEQDQWGWKPAERVEKKEFL